MGKHAKLSAGEASPVDDAGMDKFVDDDDVIRADEGRDGAQGGGIARGEAEGGGSALKGR